METEKRKFEEWEPVECDNCEAWWLNQCNGVPVGSTKPCKTFKAVRRVDIPLQIKDAQDGLERLRTVFFIYSVFQLILDMILITLSVR